MVLRAKEVIKEAAQEIKATEVSLKKKRNLLRNRPLPGPIQVEEIDSSMMPERYPYSSATLPKGYIVIQLQSSTGKCYNVTVPSTYADRVPKEWVWTDQRYEVADLIAQGIPVREIASREMLPSHITIYCWLQHPEFREHVDSLVLETGFANKRERIAGLGRVTRLLFDKIASSIDACDLNDKSVGAFIQGFGNIAKQLAQEKNEFVEQSEIKQTTTLSGVIGVAHTTIDDIMAAANPDERLKMEAHLKTIGDAIVSQLTGGSPIIDVSCEGVVEVEKK